ncbi:DNA polymerase III subunit beta [Streptomyces venezuelae]|uniref:DNA polymerase III subunit beta n=1 Tax=Streptomyces gardneri TaxID=66892 RepID=UPI0006BC2817|nr:DNA polymerase III subunit beta [Streptomyces gardneri]ALO11235.1 DNA polymerase III subunit beta [Streptomyces venezuelae]QPK48161.1 DNA polymerase III subunit beta [Streptomyces gardneri]WRK39621.1 DNA polymerase III subunit beta [Streptomyces venezuelae]CUM38250.1 DNA polymerase III beta subunit [Streptomyces venezuelae]
MEIRIDSAVLTEAVAWAARVLPARSPMPVLGGLLLEAAEGRLRVSGLDHEASARVEVEADTAVEGSALVLGRRLLDICKVLPRGYAELAVEDARLSVTSGDARFGLSLLPLDDYPAPPALPEVRGLVDGDAFAAAVGQVAVAAGRDDSLPVLTGIRLALDGSTMTVAATDRYRYAVRTLEWYPDFGRGAATQGAEPGEPADVVVPARRLTEIARSLAGGGPARLALDSGSIGFESGGMRTTTRLLDGRLPRHDKLFALGDHALAVTERSALTEAVKRVVVVAEGDSPVQLSFTASGVHLQAGYEDDVASQRLPGSLTGADSLTVAFNPAYLLDALTSLDATEVRFHLLGPGQRALLTDAEEPSHRHLLMSVKPLV